MTDTEGDVLVIAGGYFFRTHRHILQTNSGYFKSFQNDPSWSVLSPISLPTIPHTSFAALLHFMYTGQLRVTGQNIYELLFCAQMLHMPSAIEMCRQFLLGTVALPNHPQTFRQQFVRANTNVIRPIPIKRPFLPALSLSSWRPPPSTGAEVPTPNIDGPATATDPTAEKPDDREELVVDVACCDGPVTFERIVNENYKRGQTPMAEPISSRPRKPEEPVDPVDREDSNSTTCSSAIRFSCAYCNHLFKSRYCYQKHKRRHINPITGDKSDKLESMQPKDKNVTFYPCKGCGAKFPSYYFVHKHRRHCRSLLNKPPD